jgi:hypothetical protein
MYIYIFEEYGFSIFFLFLSWILQMHRQNYNHTHLSDTVMFTFLNLNPFLELKCFILSFMPIAKVLDVSFLYIYTILYGP